MAIALTDSVAGSVLEHICAAIRAMTIAGGYHWNVQYDSVRTDAVNLVGVPHEQRPLFVVEFSPDGRRAYEPANQVVDDLKVLVSAIVDVEEEIIAPTAKHATGLVLAADLERALTMDITRGGWCGDTRLAMPELLIGTGRDPSVVVVQEVECFHLHRPYGEA